MTSIEKGAFLKLFIRNGYVLDFSTITFDVFTKESIGIPLCEKYGLSKGGSLTAYCNEASHDEVVKLLSDLLSYYEINILDSDSKKHKTALYAKCKEIIDRESGSVRLETPAIACVNREYIVDLSNRAIRDVDKREYDSAITKARTLLEEVFCFALEQLDIPPAKNGSIMDLYKQVRNEYNMHTDKDIDKRVNQLLSGLNNIVSSISEMRNKNSDAHGVGANRINISEHHARLFVNSAMVMADFILSVVKNKCN